MAPKKRKASAPSEENTNKSRKSNKYSPGDLLSDGSHSADTEVTGQVGEFELSNWESTYDNKCLFPGAVGTSRTIERISRSVAMSPEPKYLNGSIKLTYSQYATATQNQNHIKFEDLLEKNGLRNAILSSYVWEDEWVFGFIPNDMDLILIRPDMKTHTVTPTLRIVQPKISGYGCMHVKLLLLNYGTFLRVVIPSANLYEFDWTGIQNIVFVQDFLPAKPHAPSTGLLKHLETILWDLGLDCTQTAFLHAFSDPHFKGQLVYSRPGTSDTLGVLALADFARTKLALTANDALDIEATTSSLGRLNEAYIHDFIRWLLGPEVSAERISESSFIVGFPTMATVLDSHDSHISRQSIFLTEENALTLPMERLGRLESKVEGGLLHAKTIVACRKANADSNAAVDGRPIGFYYAGSHNFTKAAWGWRTASGKITIRNYELGVVFPITNTSQLDTDFPISYKRPMQPYRSGYDDPWIS